MCVCVLRIEDFFHFSVVNLMADLKIDRLRLLKSVLMTSFNKKDAFIPVIIKIYTKNIIIVDLAGHTTLIFQRST